ncbi:hypothetical protein CYME_CMT201C [Cyanidioschyzon merolae strain 10D]|jgi:hypothetical protein|uniref:Large ribosomal subunit protein mL59 domain-containing protein n=1 Tax=Cyanidioschyzon merolae (strain NIES-3377 / 10D) TaxID=280699 RepID=M1V7K9_CYAM1|nr:hypothetical protein CYME_CMT201C [Cyanidioschyzon merolae strain 10D]BAM83190.1 hypothetical protein CYME_CMT201C [Cyanidioschyzon merolae strain 10D]|eukprot:XP_005539226.1 hypothetical protein CYME_CMT201C [Cyanidioschyzon merolae strain 10D]
MLGGVGRVWGLLVRRARSSAAGVKEPGSADVVAGKLFALTTLPASHPHASRRLLPVNVKAVEAAKKRLPPGMLPQVIERPLTEREALWRQARLLDDSAQPDSLRVGGLTDALTSNTRVVWRPPKVTARQRAYLRRQCLLRGVPWPFDIPRKKLGVVIHTESLAKSEPSSRTKTVSVATLEEIGAEMYLRYLRKGHKWERERAFRQALIAERMKEMDQLIQQCRAERRALRLGKVIGGKKPKKHELIELVTRDIEERALAIPAGMKRRAELVRVLPSRTMRLTKWPLNASTETSTRGNVSRSEREKRGS